MASLAGDLRLALDRVGFASSLGLDPDPWQERLLRSTSPRVLLNCSRQSGKSTMSGVMALHLALYFPGSLALCLAPSERQSKELFAKVSDSYRRLRGTPAPASDRKLRMLIRGNRGSGIHDGDGRAGCDPRGYAPLRGRLRCPSTLGWTWGRQPTTRRSPSSTPYRRGYPTVKRLKVSI